MSTLTRRPLCPLLNVAVQVMAAKVWPQGFDKGPDAPSSYEALCAEYERRGMITVWDGASGQTIFDDPDINVMFRAWHDYCHITGGHDFSLEGERQAALMQCEHIKARYGDGETGQELCRLIMIEVCGQAAYAEAHGGEFPVDQMAFTKAYLALGDTALTATF